MCFFVLVFQLNLSFYVIIFNWYLVIYSSGDYYYPTEKNVISNNYYILTTTVPTTQLEQLGFRLALYLRIFSNTETKEKSYYFKFSF